MGISKKNLAKAKQLAEELDRSIKPGPKPTMDEIVAEIRAYRASIAKNPSDFIGVLTLEESEKFDKHTRKIRNECDRDSISNLPTIVPPLGG